MSSTEVATREPQPLADQSLEELAATANREHELAIEAGESMLAHAIRVGEALLEARGRCTRPGEWTSWINSNFSCEQEAYRYMHLANNAEVVRQHATMKGALREIKLGGRKLPPMPLRTLPEADLAAELAEDGLSCKGIATAMGVSYNRAWELVNREKNAERRRARERRQAEQLQLATRERKRRQRDEVVKRAVKKAGAATQELYAIAERTQDILAQAHDETSDAEAREALDRAGQHYRRMRDEIVRALGAS